MTDAPTLRVVRGEPDDAELAALLAVLAARSGGTPPPAPPPSPWRDRGRSLHAPAHHGPGAWRASGLPR